MRRINLGSPYEDFIEKMVDSGYYSTATEVIRDAIRNKMSQLEDDRIAYIKSLIIEGQNQIDNGQYKKVDQKLFKSILVNGTKKAKSGDSILPQVMP